MDKLIIAVVLDLMGTFINREQYHFEAFEQAVLKILEVSLPALWIVANIPGACGGGDEHVVRGIMRHLDIADDEIERRLLAEKEVLFTELTSHVPLEARPGSLDAVRLFQNMGYTVTIGTNTRAEKALPVIETIGLGDHIAPQYIVCAGGSIRRKPYPDIFFEIARRLNIPPQHLVAFGDSLLDAEAATHVPCFWVATPIFSNAPKVMEGILKYRPIEILTDWQHPNLEKFVTDLELKVKSAWN